MNIFSLVATILEVWKNFNHFRIKTPSELRISKTNERKYEGQNICVEVINTGYIPFFVQYGFNKPFIKQYNFNKNLLKVPSRDKREIQINRIWITRAVLENKTELQYLEFYIKIGKRPKKILKIPIIYES